MSNKKKSANVKPESAATSKTKASPRRETVEGTELVEASGKQDLPIPAFPADRVEKGESVESFVKKDETPVETPEEDLMTVQVGNHTIQVPKEPDGEFTEEDKANAVDTEWVLDRLAAYFDAYPNEEEFHLTSDGQVFLKANKNEAKDHQKFLNDGKDVLVFTLK